MVSLEYIRKSEDSQKKKLPMLSTTCAKDIHSVLDTKSDKSTKPNKRWTCETEMPEGSSDSQRGRISITYLVYGEFAEPTTIVSELFLILK